MTFGSLFAGIGGMDLGLERAGMECRWQVEINPYCQKVLSKHWPDVKRYGDIRELTGADLERVDLIAGGFPCQDVSQAGRRAGIEGQRSGLYAEMLRLAPDLRPRFILMENVTGLLVRGMGRVLGDLAALGFDAEWDCIPAAAVGAPHLRDRVFILAYPAGAQRVGTIFAGNAGDDVLPKAEWGKPAKRSPDRFLSRLVPGIHPRILADWWRHQSRVDRTADGIPGQLDRVAALGNAVVPQVAEWIGRQIMQVEQAF